MQASIWEKESFYSPNDIIIVGKGFVGLWSAYYLKKKYPKLTITIVDRDSIPAGASTRNAGFACFGSLTELLDDSKKSGESNMLELVRMRYNGIQQIHKVFRDREIDFDLCGGYEFITSYNDPGKEKLNEQIDYLNRLLCKGIKEKRVFKLADKKIRKFGFNQVTHLLENKLEGYLHSGKLYKALLNRVQSMGVIVIDGIEIVSIETTASKVILSTNLSLPFTADKVLVCTNAFAKQLLPELDVIPARGQILLTAPIPDIPFKGTFHYDGGFYYFRNLGNRVLLGGARNKAFEEETTTDMSTTDKIQQELEYFLSHYIIPGKTYTITDRWSGIMAMGSEKMPIVKEVSPRLFCAVRMSGMGVALAPVVGEKIAKLMI